MSEFENGEKQRNIFFNVEKHTTEKQKQNKNGVTGIAWNSENEIKEIKDIYGELYTSKGELEGNVFESVV